MKPKMSRRGRTAVGLLVTEAFLDAPALRDEDRRLARQGVSRAWDWVEGRPVPPIELCEYVDGAPLLPDRSMAYAKGSPGREALIAAFLSIGIAALWACEEAGERATESVENFGEDQVVGLREMVRQLAPDARARIERCERWVAARTGGEPADGAGAPLRREELVAAMA